MRPIEIVIFFMKTGKITLDISLSLSYLYSRLEIETLTGRVENGTGQNRC